MNVVDASVTIKWVYAEPEADAAYRVLTSEPGLAAPALWLIESAGVLCRKHKEGKLDARQVADRLTFLRDLPILAVDTATLVDEGVRLSLELKHPLYDCLYLALARGRSSRLILADYDFARVASRGGYEADLLRLDRYDQP